MPFPPSADAHLSRSASMPHGSIVGHTFITPCWISGNPPLTVISPFGSAGLHVLVLEVDDSRCGLLVDSVTGLRRVDDADIRPAPRGQHDELVSGSVVIDGAMVLLADPRAVAQVPDHG